MEQQTVEEIRIKHLENYKNAVYEIMKNNSKSLFEDDILSLLQKPPLDSMDIIKCKILDLAKRYKTVIQIESLNKCLDSYRKDAMSLLLDWEKFRIERLEKIIFSFQPKKNSDIIKINKKEFNLINKELKKQIKRFILDLIDKNIVKNVNSLFTNDVDGSLKDSLSKDIIKFLQTNYLKQLLESMDFKVIVKDTTLINRIKEQGERYLFTLNNSHLLNE